jgi:hypothetical protein
MEYDESVHTMYKYFCCHIHYIMHLMCEKFHPACLQTENQMTFHFLSTVTKTCNLKERPPFLKQFLPIYYRNYAYMFKHEVKTNIQRN